MLVFSCTACGKRLKARCEQAGKKARCSCGQAIIVPAAQDDSQNSRTLIEQPRHATTQEPQVPQLMALIWKKILPGPRLHSASAIFDASAANMWNLDGHARDKGEC